MGHPAERVIRHYVERLKEREGLTEEVAIDTDDYLGPWFDPAYEFAATMLGRRPKLHVIPNLADADLRGVVGLTTKEDLDAVEAFVMLLHGLTTMFPGGPE